MKVSKPYFDLNFGVYCGVFVDEPTMKKVAKLLYKQNQELKDLLMNNIDSLKVSNWTLAYPNGKQETIHYINDNDYETPEKRISIIDKTKLIKRVEHMYIGTAKEAVAEHMRLYDQETEVFVGESVK